MAFPQGINFRATTGYVTDGSGEYCQIAPGTGGNYPTTTPQGNTVGWEGTAFGQVDSRDRSTSIDHRLAGSNFTTTAATATYRIDLPAAGTYNIRLAAGDASFTSNVQIELFDDTTSLGVLASATSLSGGQFKDAANATLTSANWPANNTAVSKTFSSAICRIKVGNTAGSSRFINHFYIEAASGGGVTGTLAVAEGADTLSAAGSPVIAGTLAKSESADTITASGSVTITGTLASAEGTDSLGASGSVAAAAITGTLASTEGADTLAATATNAAPVAAGDGGGAGNVREVRAFADLLDKAHKLTRSQKKKRRAELIEEVREALPPLPEAEQIAPAIARIVFEQESQARAMYANRPIEAMAPVVAPFDAKAAIAELVARFMADEAMRRQIEAEQSEEDEIDAFLLLGS